MVASGSVLAEVWVGLACSAVGSAVSARTLPMVGMGCRVGLIVALAISVGMIGLCFGEQLARAAPAATVAVSLMNIRREMGGRRFMGNLRGEYV